MFENDTIGENMRSLEWTYEKNIDEWQSIPRQKNEDIFYITEINGAYYLYQNNKSFANFEKLANAKKVAQLIAFG